MWHFKLVLVLSLFLLCPIIVYAQNISIEGQLYNKAGNQIITGTHNLNITLKELSNTEVHEYIIVTDDNGRFFVYINTTLNFTNAATVSFSLENYDITSDTIVGYVPKSIFSEYANNSKLLNGRSDYLPLTGGYISGNIYLLENVYAFKNLTSDRIQLNTSTTFTTLAIGQMAWDSSEDTISVGMPYGATYQMGHELYKLVTNIDSVDLGEATAVSIEGVGGGREGVKRTNASNPSSATAYIGLTTTPIAKGEKGWVAIHGDLHKVNTNLWTEGRPLYVNETSPGNLTTTYPTAPNYAITVGLVTVKHAVNGIISTSTGIALRLSDLSDVDGAPIDTSGLVLVWNNDTRVWNATANIRNLTMVGLTVGNSSGNITINDVGFITLNGEATVWDDVMVSLNGAGKPATNPFKSGAFIGTIETPYFSDAALNSEENADLSIQIPHRAKQGSVPEFHCHGSPNNQNATNQNVTFSIDYTCANISGIFSPVRQITKSFNLSLTPIPGGNYTHNVLDFGNLTGCNIGLSEMILLRLHRNSSLSSDSFNNNFYIISCDAHIEISRLGSDLEISG